MSGAGDLVFGVVVTVVFLALVVAAGLVLYRIKNARFGRVWAPLVPVVSGRVRGDGGGGATSWLDGAYAGREVHASAAPGAGDSGRTGSTTTGMAYNAFAVMLVGRPGGRDWKLLYSDRGAPPWQLDTDDPALAARLTAGGLVERAAGLGRPSPAITTVRLPVLAYTARDGLLHFREDAGSALVPPPDRFRAELDTLVGIAALDEQLNR